MSDLRVLIAAGGTGGHVYPALAIADEIRSECPEAEILFVGTRNHLEWRKVPEAGYDIAPIWISGFHRRFTPKNLLFPVKLLASLFQSLALLYRFDPDVVISCGGYVAGPAGWVAGRLDIPLVIQEQNSFPGITNRLLAKDADWVFIAFEEAAEYFDPDRTTLAGNPVRKSLVETTREEACSVFNFDPHTPTLLVLGGSGGAKSINRAMMNHIDQLHDRLGLQILWQCGKRYFDLVRSRLDTEHFSRLRLKNYIDRMAEAYRAADLAVTRAGALTCSELALTGTPSILVPSPNVAGDHQAKNARSMTEEGAAVASEDGQIDDELTSLVENMIFDREKLGQMQRAARNLGRPDASSRIADKIIAIATDRAGQESKGKEST